MKKIISIIIVLIILNTPILSSAMEIPGYEGGINNENTYKEVIFVTGEAIELEGTLKMDIKESKEGQKENYTFSLENKALDVKLSRKIRLDTIFEKNGSQTTAKKNLDSYKETISVAGKKYEVSTENYQWNQGQVVEDTGLLEFYAGDWSARKKYLVNKGDEEVIVQTIGRLVGYHSPWSGTETQSLDYIINYENKVTDQKPWQATATVETSYNKTKDYNYVENVPDQISFRGGYILTEKDENTLKYKYDLPLISESGNENWRNLGQGSTQIDTNPLITRLNLPALRDIRGLASEKDILLIASMEGFPIHSTVLGPSTPMSRGDFAKTLVASMGIEVEDTATKKPSRSSRRKEEDKTMFIDVASKHRNYKYIEAVGKRGIIQGVGGIGKVMFQPDRPVTNAEAMTILIRMTGLQAGAPIQSYTTGYKDDSSIPKWAKDHVYIAKELGILPNSEYFYPNRAITKEETATSLVNFIDYLQTKLPYDFRENILNN